MLWIGWTRNKWHRKTSGSCWSFFIDFSWNRGGTSLQLSVDDFTSLCLFLHVLDRIHFSSSQFRTSVGQNNSGKCLKRGIRVSTVFFSRGALEAYQCAQRFLRMSGRNELSRDRIEIKMDELGVCLSTHSINRHDNERERRSSVREAILFKHGRPTCSHRTICATLRTEKAQKTWVNAPSLSLK